jgi:hypothetical protein
LGAAGNVAGSDLSEVGHVFRVPTSNPAVSTQILGFAALNTGVAVDQSNSIGVRLLADSTGAGGSLEIQANGATTSDYRRLRYNGFRSVYSGKLVRLDIVLTSGSNLPNIYIDGIDITSSFSLTTLGTPPNWMDASLVSTYRGCFFNWLSLDFTPGFPINRALNASEIRQMIDSGEESASDGLGGNQTGFISQLDSDFSAGVGNWLNYAGGTVSAGAGSTLAISSVGFGGARLVPSNWARPQNFGPGRYRVSFSITGKGGTNTWQVAFETGEPLISFNSNGNYSVEAFSRVGSTQIIIAVGGGTDSLLIDNIQITQIGALIQPTFQPGPVIADSGPNGISGVCIGMNQIAHNSICGEISSQVSWSGTHEPKRIFATATPYLPQNAVITSITTKATAASTGSGLTIGTTNSNNRYVTLNTYTTAAKSHALSNRIPASTATNDLDIVIDPDTANYTGTISVTIKYYVSSPL